MLPGTVRHSDSEKERCGPGTKDKQKSCRTAFPGPEFVLFLHREDFSRHTGLRGVRAGCRRHLRAAAAHDAVPAAGRGLWVRSSPRLYEWLLAHRCFGGYIRNFRENRAIPLRAKVVSIALMWGTMLYCIFGLLDGWWWAQVGLLAVAVGVTWHILSFATLRK